jgi:hypothetical protein
MPTRKVVLADLDASRLSSLAPSVQWHNRGKMQDTTLSLACALASDYTPGFTFAKDE